MFRIKIALGNEAMQSPQDVAAALRGVAEKLEALDPGIPLEECDPYDCGGKIRDINGNTVGQWGC